MAKGALQFMAGTVGSLAVIGGATVLATTGVVAVGKQIVLARKVRVGQLETPSLSLNPAPPWAWLMCASYVGAYDARVRANARVEDLRTASGLFMPRVHTVARGNVTLIAGEAGCGPAESRREAVPGLQQREDHAL